MSATALRCLGNGTAHLCLHIPVFTDITSLLKLVHIFIARNRVFKSCLMAELCFHCFVHFGCALIYIYGFHHKQCASY